MRRILSGSEFSPDGSVVALGTFDGVHLGHRALLSASRKIADRMHLPLLVFSVERRPGDLPGAGTGFLTGPEEKARLLEEAGADLFLSRPLLSLRDLSPALFCRKILLEECRVRAAVCGFDFRFGKNAAGDAAFLSDALKASGVSVTVLDPVLDENGEKISSSAIRLALAKGDTEKAGRCLGRPFSLFLPVLHGKGMGHTLGFATINQLLPADAAPLRHGVYAVTAVLDGKELPGVCNVGVRPTFPGDGSVYAETHLFDFQGDLYGKSVRILFFRFLRDETTFASPEELTRQVERDKEQAKAYFARNQK